MNITKEQVEAITIKIYGCGLVENAYRDDPLFFSWIDAFVQFGIDSVKGVDYEETKFLAVRLRRVCKLVGLEDAIPESDETLAGTAGTVLGMVARKLDSVKGEPVALRSAELPDYTWKFTGNVVDFSLYPHAELLYLHPATTENEQSFDEWLNSFSFYDEPNNSVELARMAWNAAKGIK